MDNETIIYNLEGLLGDLLENRNDENEFQIQALICAIALLIQNDF